MLQGGMTEEAGSPNYGGTAIGNIVLVPDVLAVRMVGFVDHTGGFVTRVAPVSDGATVTQAYKNTGEDYQYGGSISLLWKPTDAFSANLKMMLQDEDLPNGFSEVYRGNPGFDPTSLTVVREYNNPEWATNNWQLPALTLTYAADKWNLVSSTSYFAQNAYNSEDVGEAEHQLFAIPFFGSYTNFGSVSGGEFARTLDFQQEFRLSFNPTDRFSGMVAAYYAHNENLGHSADRQIPGISGLTTPFTGLITTDTYFYTTNDSVTMQKALYGNLSYNVGIFTATAGMRYYQFNQPSHGTSLGFIIGDMTTVPTHSNTTASGTSPRFTLTAQPSASSTVYASAAKGFRPGAAGNGTPPLPQCVSDLEALGISTAQYEAGYKPDSVWTYEFGAKQQLFHNRMLVTGALFQTNWNDIQQSVSLRCGISFTGNAGAARVRGGEIEIDGNVTERLSLQAAFGYTDAIITDDAGGTTNQAVGSSLYDVPKENGSIAGTYTVPMADGRSVFLTADATYTGSSLSSNNSTSSPGVRGSYTLVNARIGYRWNDNELSLNGTNLTNKLANYGDAVPDISSSFTLTTGQSVPHAMVDVAQPLTVGIQYRHGF